MSFDESLLKVKALRGATWTIAAVGVGQVIRLGQSLLLTRLLFPEAFGLMTLVMMVMYGLEMLSDVGIAQAITRDKRGDEPRFLNTAWTLQGMRGAVLWGIACLLSRPIASFYGEPDLADLLPVAALTALISGFSATAPHTLRRRMEFGKLTLLELSGQILTLFVAISWAVLSPTVWALVGATLAGQFFHMVMSHRLITGFRNSFYWESSSGKELIRFGKWIFLSSALTFISVQSDRILLGRLVELSLLGVYSIALMISEALSMLANRVSGQVLFPAYANIIRSHPVRLRNASYKARLGIDILFVVPIASLLVLGNWLVHVLYDDRYQEAGWMLQILCIRALMSCTLTNGEACLVALGHPQYAVGQNFLHAVWIVVGIPVGWHIGGMAGVVWVVALSGIPKMLVLWTGLIRYEVFSIAGELRTLLAAAFGALLGMGLLRILP